MFLVLSHCDMQNTSRSAQMSMEGWRSSRVSTIFDWNMKFQSQWIVHRLLMRNVFSYPQIWLPPSHSSRIILHLHRSNYRTNKYHFSVPPPKYQWHLLRWSLSRHLIIILDMIFKNITLPTCLFESPAIFKPTRKQKYLFWIVPSIPNLWYIYQVLAHTKYLIVSESMKVALATKLQDLILNLSSRTTAWSWSNC